MSDFTKNAFGEALKRKLCEKPLNKITIREIADECGLNRMTFYYHFKNIYDLVGWLFEKETEEAIGKNRSLRTWQQAARSTLEAAVARRQMIENVCRSAGWERTGDYLYRHLKEYLGPMIEERGEALRVAKGEQEFIADFGAHALSGILVDWFKEDMRKPPEVLTAELDCILHDTLTPALKRFSQGSVVFAEAAEKE